MDNTANKRLGFLVIMGLIGLALMTACSGLNVEVSMGDGDEAAEATDAPAPTQAPSDTPIPPTTAPEPTTDTTEPSDDGEAADDTGEACTLDSGFVADVTVPDGTEFEPGEGFTKTWRLENDGNCDWPSGTELIFVSGDQMNAPASVPADQTAPGGTADVSVPLQAPDSEGNYRGYFQLRAPDGTQFGPEIFVDIRVKAASEGGSGSGGSGDIGVVVPVPTLDPDVIGDITGLVEDDDDGDGGGGFVLDPILVPIPTLDPNVFAGIDFGTGRKVTIAVDEEIRSSVLFGADVVQTDNNALSTTLTSDDPTDRLTSNECVNLGSYGAIILRTQFTLTLETDGGVVVDTQSDMHFVDSCSDAPSSDTRMDGTVATHSVTVEQGNSVADNTVFASTSSGLFSIEYRVIYDVTNGTP